MRANVPPTAAVRLPAGLPAGGMQGF